MGHNLCPIASALQIGTKNCKLVLNNYFESDRYKLEYNDIFIDKSNLDFPDKSFIKNLTIWWDMGICKNLSNATLFIAYVFLFLFCLVFHKGENDASPENVLTYQEML